ncbi:hypothetical protein MKX01_035502 [Papaver californicum]|nr:hypothetical protein MKX01_035502 [Papaver californicum]
MAEEPQFASTRPSSDNNKRKYEDSSPPPPTSTGPRRPTGFSAPIISSVSPPDSTNPNNNNNNNNNPTSYNNVPPPSDEIQIAKQKAQEIAARLYSSAEAKRPRNENGTPIDDPNDVPPSKGGFSSPLSSEHSSYRSSGFSNSASQVGRMSSPGSMPVSYGFQGSSKKIEIPNGRVGVIIGKGGETIKYLQLQSGAKIQVTRDMDSDPHSQTRLVELMGTSEQISKAEQLITDVLSEAEAGGSGLVSKRFTGPAGAGAGQFQMKVPNNKVGLVIGKGGETIKSMQANSGARIQLIPLHPPPGDTSTERTVYIDGTEEQIEAAKQLVNEVISENRVRNSSMGGGYSQQGYRPPRPQSSWGGPPGPQSQQPGYGYMQPGAYPGAPPPYSQSGYAGYPPQPSSGWDQSSAPPSQQTTQGSGYDYYNQQSQQPPHGGSGQPAAPTYGQQQTSYGESGYAQPAGGQQGYQQEDYSGGGYHAPASQTGYGQQPGYDHSQSYGSAPAYGTSAQDAAAPAYGAAQGAPTPAQQPPPVGGTEYAGQQSSSTTAVSYPSQPGYGAPPTSQPGYGGQPPAQTGYPQSSYGPPAGQKPLPPGQAAYGQSQPPSSGQGSGYAQTAPAQAGYSQPPTSTQPGYYGAPAGTPQAGYGTQQQAYGEAYGGYSQPAPAYPTDSSTGNGHGSYESSAPGGAPPAPQSGVAKASPQS